MNYNNPTSCRAMCRCKEEYGEYFDKIDTPYEGYNCDKLWRCANCGMPLSFTVIFHRTKWKQWNEVCKKHAAN